MNFTFYFLFFNIQFCKIIKIQFKNTLLYKNHLKTQAVRGNILVNVDRWKNDRQVKSQYKYQNESEHA